MRHPDRGQSQHVRERVVARCRPGWAGWRVRRRWSRPAMPRPSGPRRRPGPAWWRGAAADFDLHLASRARPDGRAGCRWRRASRCRPRSAGCRWRPRVRVWRPRDCRDCRSCRPALPACSSRTAVLRGSDPARPSPDPFRARRRRGRPRWWPARRTAAGMGGGRRPSTCRRPRASTRLASACARISRGWAARRPSCPSDAHGCAD